MKPETYIIIHNGKGEVLLYTPCTKGYFFHHASGGVICYPQPQPARNGSAVPLPGGDMQSERLESVILRQTGIDMYPYQYHSVSMTSNTGSTCTGIYLNVYGQYEAIKNLSARNLQQAEAAVSRIAALKGDITYHALMDEFPHCPADNTLKQVMPRNLFHDREYFETLNHDEAYWLYEMFSYLRDALYPVQIYDRMNQLAAVAQSGKWQGDSYVAVNMLFDKKLLKSTGQLYKIKHIKNPFEVTLVLHALPGNDGENAVFTCDTE